MGATTPMTTRIKPAVEVTYRLRTPLTRTMPMFSPLVTIRGFRRGRRAAIQAVASDRAGAARLTSICLPTISAFTTVWPVASAIDTT